MAPIRPLTERQDQVARLLAMGFDYQRIANALEPAISYGSVQEHIAEIAELLDNPDELKPKELVMLWAAHRKWYEIALARGNAA